MDKSLFFLVMKMLSVTLMLFRVAKYRLKRNKKKEGSFRNIRDQASIVRKLRNDEMRFLKKVVSQELNNGLGSTEYMDGVGRIGEKLYRVSGEIHYRETQGPTIRGMQGQRIAAPVHGYYEIKGIEFCMPASAKPHVLPGENTVEFVVAQKTAILIGLNGTFDLLSLNPTFDEKAGFGDLLTSTNVNYLCLSPLPLPTLFKPSNQFFKIKVVSNEFMMLSDRVEEAFNWQLILGITMSIFMMFTVFPFLVFTALGVFFDDFLKNMLAAWEMLLWGAPIGAMAFFIIPVSLVYRFLILHSDTPHPPLFFHRQRREVAFYDKINNTNIVVPWESLETWVEVFRNEFLVKSGIEPSARLCFCFNGSGLKAECRVYVFFRTLSLAIATWESVRQYMGYELAGSATKEEIGSGAVVIKTREDVSFFVKEVKDTYVRYEGQWLWRFVYFLKLIVTLMFVPYVINSLEARYVAWRAVRRGHKRLGEWLSPLPDNKVVPFSKPYVEKVAEINDLVKRNPSVDMGYIFKEVCGKKGSADYEDILTFRKTMDQA